MENDLLVYKNIGETPLEAIERVKKERPELANIQMTYAGRLDPMAEGLLLILYGENRFLKDKYLGFTKEYEMEILFGFETDTYDLLGLQQASQSQENSPALPSLRGLRHGSNFPDSALLEKFKKFIGEIEQEYPPYSSKPVDGKPLFQIAREGKIDEVKIPTHKVYIESIEVIEERNITKEELQKYINEKIPLVKGDFRQDEILNNWERVLGDCKKDIFQVVKVRVACGSGAYMRVLAHDIGKELGISACAFSIKRTKIGEYKI